MFLSWSLFGVWRPARPSAGQTYKCSCLHFCLLASSVLRESEEHVTWWDKDPPWARWTLLEPTTGRHTLSDILYELSLLHTTYLNAIYAAIVSCKQFFTAEATVTYANQTGEEECTGITGVVGFLWALQKVLVSWVVCCGTSLGTFHLPDKRFPGSKVILLKDEDLSLAPRGICWFYKQTHRRTHPSLWHVYKG